MFNQSGRFTVHFRKQDRIRKLLPIKDILLSVAHSIAEPWILLVLIDFSVCNCIRPIQFESFITNIYHSIHVHVQCPSYSAEWRTAQHRHKAIIQVFPLWSTFEFKIVKKRKNAILFVERIAVRPDFGIVWLFTECVQSFSFDCIN